MLSTSILERKADKKRFKVKTLERWTDITSEDGENDRIKWLKGTEYVSLWGGRTYVDLSVDFR